MKRRTQLTALIVGLAALTLVGCSRAKPSPQTIIDAGGGAFWLLGTEGMAQRFDGQGYRAYPYPMDDDAPDWAYEASSTHKAAQGVVHRDSVMLFTSVGGVMRFVGGQWVKLPVVFDTNDPYRQLNTVLEGPDGMLVVQLHPDLLVVTTGDALLGGSFKTEKTPTFYTWLGFIDGALYGLGWEPDGETRALHRRDGPQRWTTVATMPSTQDGPAPRHPTGALVLPDGELAVNDLGGLYRLGVNVDDKARGPSNRFSEDASVAALVSGQLGYIKGVHVVPKRGTWLLGGNGVVTFGRAPQLWSCPGNGAWIGVTSTAGGVRLVDGAGAVWDLIDGQCQRRHQGLSGE